MGIIIMDNIISMVVRTLYVVHDPMRHTGCVLVFGLVSHGHLYVRGLGVPCVNNRLVLKLKRLLSS